MKKLINAAGNVLTESLDGFAAAHADIVVLGEEHKFVRRRALKPGKVALLSGGGSGHEPLHAGFVGHGMLDAACPGQVFTSPTPDQMVAAAEAVDTGAGCLFIVKNYEGDVMNFQMAADLCGREVATVITDDDVAVERSTWSTGRRGVAGTLIVERIVGAAAENGAGLAELKALGDRVNQLTRSMGVALSSCTVPAAGKPTFTLAEDEMDGIRIARDDTYQSQNTHGLYPAGEGAGYAGGILSAGVDGIRVAEAVGLAINAQRVSG